MSSPSERPSRGRFEIVRFIGRGGMGEVYEAKDLELRDHVAIKTLRPEFIADPTGLRRFKREIQLARKVTHPNICRIFDVARPRARRPRTHVSVNGVARRRNALELP